jgi:hypothetical protein
MNMFIRVRIPKTKKVYNFLNRSFDLVAGENYLAK